MVCLFKHFKKNSCCRAFSVSSESLLMFRFSILACCRSLFIYDSSLSFHPVFNFLSIVFKGIPIFSQINFAPVYIKSFNYVMSFVGIFVNKSFTFSISDLTVLQSWFLREGNGVFFSGIILLMVCILIFPLESVFAVHGSLSCSIWHGVSGFPEFTVSVTVLGFCWCVCRYICWWISSKIRKPSILYYCSNLVNDHLVCCLKSIEFCPDFYHYFSIPSFYSVTSKIIE